MRETEVRRAAETLIQTYRTHEPFSLCRALGVDVLFVPLTKNVRAFSYRGKGLDQIYLDESLSETEQVVLLAHELGHRVLHGGLNFFFLHDRTFFPLGQWEHEADLFARCLLENAVLDLTDVSPAVRGILLN